MSEIIGAIFVGLAALFAAASAMDAVYMRGTGKSDASQTNVIAAAGWFFVTSARAFGKSATPDEREALGVLLASVGAVAGMGTVFSQIAGDLLRWYVGGLVVATILAIALDIRSWRAGQTAAGQGQATGAA